MGINMDSGDSGSTLEKTEEGKNNRSWVGLTIVSILALTVAALLHRLLYGSW